MNKKKAFDLPHKALRNALSQFSLATGNTDYQNKTEVSILFQMGKDVFRMLNIHAQEEEDVTLAELELRCPGASLHDVEDHKKLHLEQKKLEDLLNEIYTKVSNEQDAAADGEELYLALSEFHGNYLKHIAEEERITQPKLWEYFTDEELDQQRIKIIQKMDADMLWLWLRFTLPAQNSNERIAILSGIKKGMPADAFNEYLERIQKLLPDEDLANWRK